MPPGWNKSIGWFILHSDFVWFPSLRLPAWGLAFIHPCKLRLALLDVPRPTRRRRILAEERARALDALGRLPLRVDDEGCRLAFERVSELAIEHGLSVYDAAYLELAIRRKLPRASRDVSLRGAGKGCGVRLLL